MFGSNLTGLNFIKVQYKHDFVFFCDDNCLYATITFEHIQF